MPVIISNDLSSKLQQLATMADAKNLSVEDKNRLEVTAAATLAEINAEIPSLNFTSAKFAERISQLISNKEWDKLPSPAKMVTDLKTLRQVAVTIQENMTSMSIDISTIMRFLIEAQRIFASKNTDASLQNRTLKLKSAQSEFQAKADANKAQKTADLLSASAEIVMGVVQMGGAAVGLVGVSKNILKSKVVKKQAVELDGLATKKTEKFEKIKITESKVAEAGKNAPNKLKRLEKLLNKTEIEFNNAETEFKVLSSKIEVGNQSIKNSSQKFDGWQQLISSSAGLAKGGVKIAESFYSYDASNYRLDAEKAALEKDMASQSEQSAQEGSRNMMQGASTALQSLSAALQSSDSSVTNQVRML